MATGAPKNGSRKDANDGTLKPIAVEAPTPAAAPAVRTLAKPSDSKPSETKASEPRLTELKPSRSGALFTDFASALTHLQSRVNVETLRPSQVDARHVFNLDRMRALMDALDNPQHSFRSVHVAGSKGKGSVCEMTAAVLQGCGYTTGLYTSPHLVHISERIRVNRQQISEAHFADVLGRVVKAAASIARKYGEATSFELLTAGAFQHFADQAVDFAVVEVGMGGRLDATNIIAPDVCALASIYLEHTQFLGTTLEQIAGEKAGIIKPGVPCVSVPQREEVVRVFRAAAEGAGAPIEFLGQEIDFSSRVEPSPELGIHCRITLSTQRSNFEHIPVPLKGSHQAINCGLALAIVDRLRARGLHMPDGLVADGLATTPSNGRLELVFTEPRIFVDGAHNPESVDAIMKAVGSQLRSDSMVVVFGCAADKDYSAMLTNIARGADKVIFTRAEANARSAEPRELARKFNEVSGKVAQSAASVKDALNLAALAVTRGDLILVIGSFAIAGEAKQLLTKRLQSRISTPVNARATVPAPKTGQTPRAKGK